MESGYCERYWYKDDEAVPREVRQCKSGLMLDDRRTGIRCKSAKHWKYGPFVNRITNRITYENLLSQTSRQCGYGDQGFDDAKLCYPMWQENYLFTENFKMENF
jgi:hypothetical protein